MASKKLSEELRAYLALIGSTGGKKSASNLSAEQRTARARAAGKKSGAVRAKRAAKNRPTDRTR